MIRLIDTERTTKQRRNSRFVESRLRTTNLTLSPVERMLSRIGIRPEEKQITLLLFSNMFFSGLTVGMTRVCAYTLFLAHFESEQLAIIAILLAVFGTLATLVINWLTRHLSVRGYIFAILAVVLTGLLAFRLSLANSHSSDLIFFLPLWFELVYMLISLQFTALLTRLFNVRQAKRLAGLTRSGEFLAEILGGLSVVFLLTLLEVEDLLLVAFIAIICVFLCVQKTVTAFQSRLQITTEDVAAEEDKTSRLLALLKQPYVRLISVCYALYIFAYFFLDVAFYDLAARQYSDQNELAAFLGQFFATTGFLTLISLAFVFAPFLKRFGILGGVIAFPLVVAAGSFLVAALDLAGLPIALIFSIMVITNGLRFVLQSSIWRPSISILFQVMPDRHRYHSNTLIEGIIDPLSGGLAGICLYCLTIILDWDSVSLLFLLAILLVLWVVFSFVIRKMYLSNLVVTLQKHKFGELTLSELDKRSLDIIENRLDSEHPAEVLYCLDLLEGLHHQQLPELISKVLDHKSSSVRMDALRRIERLRLDSVSHRVAGLIASELDVEVLGQVFTTYGALGSEDTIEKLKPYLEISTYHLHKGALVGLLRFDLGNVDAVYHLQRLVASDSNEERKLAAIVVGEIGDKAFSGLILKLLDDPDIEIVQQAILAVSDIDDETLIQPLVNKLPQLQLRPLAARVLQKKGQIALEELELVFSAAHIDIKEQLLIIDIIGQIGGPQAIRILCNLVDHDSPELRHKVYLGLANLHYEADDDVKYVYANLLLEEVNLITWLLAAMEDLRQEDTYVNIQRALSNELDQHRDNMLLLISFLYTSIVMLDTRANIDSKVAELRIFALEVLDNILVPEIKQIVLPILEDLTISEKLDSLGVRFPQARISAPERFAEVMDTHYTRACCWTRVCLLFQIGKYQMPQHESAVTEALLDAEAVVRETALWSHTRLTPDDLDDTLQRMSADTAPRVRELAQALVINPSAVSLLT